MVQGGIMVTETTLAHRLLTSATHVLHAAVAEGCLRLSHPHKIHPWEKGLQPEYRQKN